MLDSLSNEETMKLFRSRACGIINPAFDKSIPNNKKKEIVEILRQARHLKNDFKQQEPLMLSAMKLLPENPFMAMRLAFFYAGHGQHYNATTMLEKAQSLGKARGIKDNHLINCA